MMRLCFIGFSLALAACAASAGPLSPEEMAAGKKLAAAKCAACHKMYDSTKYSDQKWDYWMIKMKRKAKLNETNFTKLSRYFDEIRKDAEPRTDPIH